MHPSYAIEKLYLVRDRDPVKPHDLDQLRTGHRCSKTGPPKPIGSTYVGDDPHEIGARAPRRPQPPDPPDDGGARPRRHRLDRVQLRRAHLDKAAARPLAAPDAARSQPPPALGQAQKLSCSRDATTAYCNENRLRRPHLRRRPPRPGPLRRDAPRRVDARPASRADITSQRPAPLGRDGHGHGVRHRDRDGARRRRRRAAQEHDHRAAGRRSAPRQALGERDDPRPDHAAARTHTVGDARERMARYHIGGIPVVDERRPARRHRDQPRPPLRARRRRAARRAS